VERLPRSPVGSMWKENVKLDLADTRGESVDWIHLAQDRVQLRALSHAVDYASRNYGCVNLFSCVPVSGLRRRNPLGGKKQNHTYLVLVTRNRKLHATTPRGSQAQTDTADTAREACSAVISLHCTPTDWLRTLRTWSNGGGKQLLPGTRNTDPQVESRELRNVKIL
jgi:hypothetical protein